MIEIKWNDSDFQDHWSKLMIKILNRLWPSNTHEYIIFKDKIKN